MGEQVLNKRYPLATLCKCDSYIVADKFEVSQVTVTLMITDNTIRSAFALTYDDDR